MWAFYPVICVDDDDDDDGSIQKVNYLGYHFVAGAPPVSQSVSTTTTQPNNVQVRRRHIQIAIDPLAMAAAKSVE